MILLLKVSLVLLEHFVKLLDPIIDILCLHKILRLRYFLKLLITLLFPDYFFLSIQNLPFPEVLLFLKLLFQVKNFLLFLSDKFLEGLDAF